MSNEENKKTNENETDQNQENMPTVNEMDILKARAKSMNLSFSNNIGIDALRSKIQDKLDGKPEEKEAVNPLEVNTKDLESVTEAKDKKAETKSVERVMTLREKLTKEQMALVRCRITNLDPKKKDLPGEIVTFANEYLGTVRKYVPFGESTEDGFHLPVCIYNMLKSRKFLNIRTVRDRRTGTQSVKQNWAQEFALEVLEPLTQKELNQLAQAQIAAGSVENEAA